MDDQLFEEIKDNPVWLSIIASAKGKPVEESAKPAKKKK